MTGISAQFSIALDLIRVLAACMVVLCHFGARRMSGGQMWFLNPYGAQAVDVFFVLSGYLISAAARRENARHFVINRAARIYSVAVPAAFLTLLFDAAGWHWAPALYAQLPAYKAGHAPLPLQAAGGLLFFNQAWFLAIPVGANVPWWSLGYEVAYYAAFACFWYGGRAMRIVGPALLALLAGPDILALAPLWLAGMEVRRWHEAGGPSRGLGVALSLIAPAFWIAYEGLATVYGRPLGIVRLMRPELLQDWLIGLLFAAFLAGLPRILPTRALPETPIRFLARRSFALYLLHYPLMLCLHAALLRYAPSVSPYWMLPATLAIVLVLAEVTECRKAAWRLFFMRALPA